MVAAVMADLVHQAVATQEAVSPVAAEAAVRQAAVLPAQVAVVVADKQLSDINV